MTVPVMHVGNMRVLVIKLSVRVRVAMFIAAWVPRIVVVLVMRVVSVTMLVRECFVAMAVAVAFAQHQHDPKHHEQHGATVYPRQPLAKQQR